MTCTALVPAALMAATPDRRDLQKCSALWAGRLAPSGWRFDGPGAVDDFPRDDEDPVVYCTVEGVSWLGENRITVMSDRAKARRTDGPCRRTQQSVHPFGLPADGP